MSDRRIRRTRQALQGALIELIIERGYEATTVADIAERADVGRSTFYAHFADKEDLLRSGIDALHGWIREQSGPGRPRAEGHPALGFVGPMLQHANESRDIFRAFAGKRSGQLVEGLFHDLWIELLREGWPEAEPHALHAIAGAFGATLTWWLTEAEELGPAEVEARFCALITPILPGRARGSGPQGSRAEPEAPRR